MSDTDRAINAHFENEIAAYANLQRKGHVTHWASVVTTHAIDNGGFHFIACCPIGMSFLKGTVVDNITCTYVQSNIVSGTTPFPEPQSEHSKTPDVYEGFRAPVPAPRSERTVSEGVSQ